MALSDSTPNNCNHRRNLTGFKKVGLVDEATIRFACPTCGAQKLWPRCNATSASTQERCQSAAIVAPGYCHWHSKRVTIEVADDV